MNKINDYYEQRFISIGNIEKAQSYYSIKNEQELILEDAVNSNDRIILLGNPGIGKTTELIRLFDSLWSKKENSNIFPFYINIKNFREGYKIEELLVQSDWEKLPRIVFIFDGLDEIANIQDFVSELELFMNRYSGLNMKFVLSCRTNIYEKYLVKISKFTSFYLNNLSSDQAIRILKEKYNIIINDWNFNYNKYSYLQTPFFIEIFAKYYWEYNKLPSSDTSIWDIYVTKEFERQEVKNIKRTRIDTKILELMLEKVSVVSELMQRNYLNEKELMEILGEKRLTYLEQNPFSELLVNKMDNSKNYIFRHRNMQEYFSAKLLAKQSFETISVFIQIENTGKTHPSLFNTITFLLNLVNNETREQLFNWLQKNEPEILFTADSDRVSKVHQIRAFQSYFKTVCIENTFWITNNRTFHVLNIARFGDCEENFTYLLSMVKDCKNAHRIILSALDLLAHMTCPNKLSANLKILFEEKLMGSNLDIASNQENDDKIKAYILYCIQNYGFHKENTNYVLKLIEIFKENDDEDINRNLLYLVNDFKDIDLFFDIIYAEFLRKYKIVERVRGKEYNSIGYQVEDLILRLKSPKLFLIILNHVFGVDSITRRKLDYNNEFTSQILIQCKKFGKEDKSFIKKLFLILGQRRDWYHEEEKFIDIILETQTEKVILELFVKEKISFDSSKYLIVGILNEFNINYVIKKLSNFKDQSVIEGFRNILSHKDYSLALNFEIQMKKLGIQFSENLLSIVEIQKNNQVFINNAQLNFNLLFQKKILISEIIKIFDELKLNDIDWEIICDYPKLDEYNLVNYNKPTLLVLRRLIRDNGTINRKNVSILLSNDYPIMKEVLDIISNNTNISISIGQKDRIIGWCLKSIKKVDLSKIVRINSNKTYSIYKGFRICKVIFKFQKIFDFQIDQLVYIKYLEYCDLDNNSIQFEELKNNIGDKLLFDSLVIENINTKELHYFSLKKHIIYALENKLEQTYLKIKEYILTESYLYNESMILANYFGNTRDFEFLKICCDDSSKGLCWAAIKILVNTITENKESEFIINKCLLYLNSKAEIYNGEALNALFNLNHPNAIIRYFKMLLLSDISLRSDSFISYDNISGIKEIKKVFNFLYHGKEFAPFQYQTAREIFSTYINNLSRNERSYTKIQAILHELKLELISKNSDLFYINLFIQDSKTNYINSKSKPLTLTKAIEKVQTLCP